jgi:O-antigen ligase
VSETTKRDRFVAERYNTHNQFLDFYLGAGFIALLIFLTFIFTSFFVNRKWFMPTAMLAILIMYCMVENVFHRQIGAYYVGFILIVLITSGKTSENNALKNL